MNRDLEWARDIIKVEKDATKAQIDDYLVVHKKELSRNFKKEDVEQAKVLLYQEALRLYENNNDSYTSDNSDVYEVNVMADVTKLKVEFIEALKKENNPKKRAEIIKAAKKAMEDYNKMLDKELANLGMSTNSKDVDFDIQKLEKECENVRREYEDLKNKYESLATEYSKILISSEYTRSPVQMAAIHNEYGARMKEAYAKMMEANEKLEQLERELGDADYLSRSNDNQIKMIGNNKPIALLEDKQRKETDQVQKLQEENERLKKELEELKKNNGREFGSRSGRTLDAVMDDLLQGLDVRQKDNKRYVASNIKVSQTFKSKVCQGNYLYNIVGSVNAVISATFGSVNKFLNKIKPGNKKAQERIRALEDRINKLSEEDLMIIYSEYRGTRMHDFGMPDIVNTLLGKKIAEFVQSKVAQINVRLTTLYNKMNLDFHSIIEIDRELSSKKTNNKRREELQQTRASLIKGKAAQVAEIRDLQNEAVQWFSGGEHGFAEDMKAAKTKMSIVGYRFSKKHDLNNDLLHKQRVLRDGEQNAINEEDDEKAFENFMGYEKLQMDNTKVKNSIFGKRSVGERYYSPLVSELEYRDDPFIRDLLTTVAVVGSTINIAGNIMDHMRVQQQVKDYNSSLDGVQDQFKQAQARVNQYGDELASKDSALLRGQQAQLNQGELAGMNTMERMNLDRFGWGSKGLSSKGYKEADAFAHTDYNASFDNVTSAINDVASKYGKGSIDSVQAMQQMAKIQTDAQNRLTAIYSEYQPIISEYAASHPQFDLHALEGSLSNLVSNSNALGEAAQAQVDIMNIARELQNLTLEGSVEGITIAQSMIPTIIGASSAYALAANVATSMCNKAKTGKYGNEITELVSQISESEMEEFRTSMHR